MPAFEFVTLDVFTSRPFGGNPLAVLPDARGLDDATMQAIATEFNLSETVFLFPPPDGSDAIATARIFTPVAEIPFAGHPNVGASFVVASRGGVFGRESGDRFFFDEKAGAVECFVEGSRDLVETSIAAPLPLSVGEEIDVDTVAACASLEPDAVEIAAHRPAYASVGLPFIMAQLRSLDDLARAKPSTADFVRGVDRYRPADDFFALYVYVRDPADPAKVRSRMFSPLHNIPEDPATGSAAAALAGLLSRLDGPEIDRRYDIVQGVEMGRRSDIVAQVSAGRVRVGGPCVPIQSGVLTI